MSSPDSQDAFSSSCRARSLPAGRPRRRAVKKIPASNGSFQYPHIGVPLFLFVAGLLGLGTPPAHAATITWINPSPGLFNDANNWDTATVPGPGDDAIIANGVTVTHQSLTTSINSLTSNGLFILSGGSLSVDAASAFNSLTLSRDLGGNGAIVVSGGTT